MAVTVPLRSLCVTRGAIAPGGRVSAPTFRAVAVGTTGDDVGFYFDFEGRSPEVRALASGQVRRQLGLKLRAMDGCNLVYVMWRLDPRPQIEVSTKINPGSRTHAECGARGYAKVIPGHTGRLPPLVAGSTHWMYAQIQGDELRAWVDGQVAWEGRLPEQARYVQGPAGLRSDNVAYRIRAVAASPGGAVGVPRCLRDGED